MNYKISHNYFRQMLFFSFESIILFENQETFKAENLRVDTEKDKNIIKEKFIKGKLTQDEIYKLKDLNNYHKKGLTEKIFNTSSSDYSDSLTNLSARKDKDIKQILELFKISEEEYKKGTKKLPLSIQDAIHNLEMSLSYSKNEIFNINTINDLIDILVSKVEEEKSKKEKSKENEKTPKLENMTILEFRKLRIEERLPLITKPSVSIKDLKNGKTFDIDFKGNYGLERQVTLADILTPEIREVSVNHDEVKDPYSQCEQKLSGKRDGLSGQFWSFNEKGHKEERLMIFSNTKVTINKASKEEEAAKNNEISKKLKELIDKKPQDLPENISNNYESILKKSLESGIDPDFIVSLMKLNSGDLFNNILKGLGWDNEDPKNFDLNTALIAIANYENQFKRKFSNNEIYKNGKEKYSIEFISYFAEEFFKEDNSLKNLVSLYYGNTSELDSYLNKAKDFQKTVKKSREEKFDTQVGDGKEILSFKDKKIDIYNIQSTAKDISDKLESCAGLKNLENSELNDYISFTPNCYFSWVSKDVSKDFIAFAITYKSLSGSKLILSETYRDFKTQQYLIDHGYKAARVGYSGHNIGASLDISNKSRYMKEIGGINGFYKLARTFNFSPTVSGEDWHLDHNSRKKGDIAYKKACDINNQMEGKRLIKNNS